MSSADDTATNFAMMSAELLNGMGFLLMRTPGGADDAQAAERVALLKKALREQVVLVSSMRPDRIQGPETFDIAALESEARQLSDLLDAWVEPAGPVPEQIRQCALRVMRAMGFGEAHIAAFGG
jgi:hypothetical protein